MRLSSISEFMQRLNQVISRQANIEERCTGRFWEGRYKSQPLLTEEALLTAIPKALRGADSGLRGPKPHSRHNTQCTPYGRGAGSG
ncbi:MAG: hypothetical protein ACI93R_004209 [Flavobacteriales bacterium]